VAAGSRARGDGGITLILFAAAMVAIVTIVALVVDLSRVRNSRQDNKRTTDVAATAGAQELAPDGVPHPWAGVCAAFAYLKQNQSDLTLTPTYQDGNEDPVGGDPCATALDQECVPGDETTWAWIHASDGDFVVDIKSGYLTPDADFSEDASSYASDNGDPAQGGCDQLAVIVARSDPRLFGGMVGADSYDTKARSVSRVEIGSTGTVAIALVLLEQEDCQALNFAGGGSGGEIIVKGSGGRPGIIHADSSGDGDDCNAGRTVVVGKQNGGPRVRALAAPSDATTYGIVSTYAKLLGGTNDARWTPDRTAAATEVWTCDPDDGVTAGPSPCPEGEPVGNPRVTRTPADDRYLSAITDRRIEANAIFNQMSPASSVPTGYTRYTSVGGNCNLGGGNPNVTITAAAAGTHLYVDCNNLNIGNNKEVVIEAGITHVAFRGTIGHSGNGLLDIRAPEEVLVRGGPGAAIDTGSSGRLRINANGFGVTSPGTACADRYAAAPSATTEMVIANGSLSASGGGSTWMCSTSLHLMGGTTSASPVNTSAGSYPAPYNNSQNGFFAVGGGGGVQWTAPNTVLGEPTVGAYRFEDLAVWSEAQANNLVSGGGATVLKGVFFLPNTGPPDAPGGLQIGGTSSSLIQLDAQLWVRKLDHNGTPRLSMRANPADSIKVPFLAGVGLVR
jgi:hypothetical protein